MLWQSVRSLWLGIWATSPFCTERFALNECHLGSTPLLGVGGSSGPINSFRGWQYFLIFLVLALGSVIHTNLFQPDPALEVDGLLELYGYPRHISGEFT